MIEVGTKHHFDLLLIPEEYIDCWGDDSEIVVECFEDSNETIPATKLRLFFDGTKYDFCTPIPKKQISYSDKTLMSMTVMALEPSDDWDDINIVVKGTPKSDIPVPDDHVHAPCESEPIILTAYRIAIEVNEKPWGGEWHLNGGAEDADVRVVNEQTGETRPWYHLWSVNENAIRATVEPECLAEDVRDVEFRYPIECSLSYRDFLAEEEMPSYPDLDSMPVNPKLEWKKILSGVGAYMPIHARIHLMCGDCVESLCSDSSCSSSSSCIHSSVSCSTSGDHTLTGWKNPIEIVVNNIASVVWEQVDINEDPFENKIRLESNPLENGGGLRCFPEKDSPNGIVNNEINVKVTLQQQVPAGMWATVYVDWFDPDNEKGSTKKPPYLPNGDKKGKRDNHGDIQNLESKTLEFTFADQKERTVKWKIDKAHAGDNYIVAAHPNTGVVDKYVFANQTQHVPGNNIFAGRTLLYPKQDGSFGRLPNNMQTPMLTVWRTLWVELDRMVVPNPNPNSLHQPPKPNISLAQSALKKACIDAKEVPGGWNSRPTANYANPLGAATIPNYLAVSNSCRDITLAQVIDTFWLVHGIGVYHSYPVGGLGYASSNLDGGSFFVFRSAMNQNLQGGIEGQWQRTTYHEIMHYFGLNDVTLAISDIMQLLSDALASETPPIIITPEELESILEEEHDGRIYEFFLNHYPQYAGYPNGLNNPYVPNDPNNLIQYPHPWGSIGAPEQGIMDYITMAIGTDEQIQLSSDQIRQIQEIAKPRPYSKPEN